MRFPQVAAGVRAKLIRLPLVLALVYIAAATLGSTITLPSDQLRLVSPAAGIALAALLLLGDEERRDGVVGLFAGAVIANLIAREPLLTVLPIAIGNTLEAVVAAWLIRRFAGTPLSRSWLRCMIAIVAFGAVASTVIGATIGVTSLCLTGIRPWTSFGALWRTWWLAGATGDLIIAPAVLAFGARPRGGGWPQRIEVASVAATLSAASVAVFARRVSSTAHNPLEYLVFPFLIWTAIRFGVAGAAMANLLTATVAIVGTVHALGPYASGAGLQFQIFLGVIASSGLLLGATVSDRDASRARKAGMLEAAIDGVVSLDEAGHIVEFNPAAERMFGLTRADAMGREFADLTMPERRREFFRRTMRPAMLGRRFETLSVRADGTEFPVELSVSRVPTIGPSVFTAFVRDITEQRRLVKQLAFRATHDGLTSMLNNAAFMERLTLAARQANVGGRADMAVLFVDLNKFKAINDRHGHIVGDRLLVAIARRLRGAVRPSDSVARLGGDEFAVLLEHVVGPDDVDAVVSRIQRALAQPFNVDGHTIHASASVGVALASEHGPRPEDLLRAADSSMYRVKSVGT